MMAQHSGGLMEIRSSARACWEAHMEQEQCLLLRSDPLAKPLHGNCSVS